MLNTSRAWDRMALLANLRQREMALVTQVTLDTYTKPIHKGFAIPRNPQKSVG